MNSSSLRRCPGCGHLLNEEVDTCCRFLHCSCECVTYVRVRQLYEAFALLGRILGVAGTMLATSRREWVNGWESCSSVSVYDEGLGVAYRLLLEPKQWPSKDPRLKNVRIGIRPTPLTGDEEVRDLTPYFNTDSRED